MQNLIAMNKKSGDAPFEEIAYDWLRSIRLPVNKQFVTRELTTHTDYPSLLSLIDLLELGGMKYQAIQSSRENIHAFNYPLLAHIQEDGKEYMLPVNAAADWGREAALQQSWSGIVLFPEGKPQWQHSENTRRIRQQQMATAIGIGAILVFLLIIAYVFRNGFLPLQAIWGLLSLAGLSISVATVATELGMQLKVVNSMCNSISPRGCDAVLNSKYANGAFGISISALSLTYFLTQFIFFFFSAWNPLLLTVVQSLAVPVMAITFFSVYAQAFVLKKWCALCLGIVSVLLMQGLLPLLSGNALFPAGSLSLLINFFLAQAMLTAIWIPVRNGIKGLRVQLEEAAELKKWKRDQLLFTAQWEEMPAVDVTLWPEELVIGDPGSPLHITVACNPYCGPCARDHKAMHLIHQLYPDKCHIRFRFTCSPGSMDKRTEAVKALLVKGASLPDDASRAQMLDDWFAFMDMEKWKERWGIIEEKNVEHLLTMHHNWIEEANIIGTPTLFINGRRLPRKYTAMDLVALIPVLAASSAITNMPEEL